MIGKENAHYLPFLLSTTFLMEAVKKGAGREAAHESIKENAVAAVKALRTGGQVENDFVARIARDAREGAVHLLQHQHGARGRRRDEEGPAHVHVRQGGRRMGER